MLCGGGDKMTSFNLKVSISLGGGVCIKYLRVKLSAEPMLGLVWILAEEIKINIAMGG